MSALGDCRTYVHIDGEPSFEKWNRGAAEGRSFFTTGPILELTVNDRLPGDLVSLSAGKQNLRIKVRMQAPVAAANELFLIEAGEVRQRKELTEEHRLRPFVWETEIAIDLDMDCSAGRGQKWTGGAKMSKPTRTRSTFNSRGAARFAGRASNGF